MAGCCILQKLKVNSIEWLILQCVLVSTVTLDSSSDSVCPGDTVVFTCTSDTGELIWGVTGVLFYFSTSQVPDVEPSFLFKFTLTSSQGSNLVTTATVDNVQLDDNGTVITCADNGIHQLANFATKELVIFGTVNNNYNCAIVVHVFVGPPNVPFKLKYCVNFSSVVISWAAPLDTPLCVHSYTVTVRNSSQVKVYNTTDNRSSLSITDLTSDGEYSVTVAGRDGAGRLGQESEELVISLIVNLPG